MTKKNKLYIFIFFIAIIFLVLVFHNVPCLFKLVFHIPCPGCGLTRAFKELFKLNISKALYYNILCIPIIIFFIYWFILFIKDLIKKENNSIDKIIFLLKKSYILIIILLIIQEIINIIHKI